VVLRAVTPEDDDELLGWFPDAAALRRFAGDTLQWPLTTMQLRAVRDGPGVQAWTAWAEVRRAGHAELIRLDGAARGSSGSPSLRMSASAAWAPRCWAR